MPDKVKLTTVQIDVETSRQLGVIAKANQRSKSAQVTFWVKENIARLELSKTFPVVNQPRQRRNSDYAPVEGTEAA